MPRIRYLKQKQKDLTYEDLFPYTTDNEQDDEDYTNPTTQQKGWWSTSAIIRSLPEKKIRQAIENYRMAISLLENELVSRRVSPTENLRQYSRLVIQETRQTTGRSVQSLRTNQRQYVGILKKLRLNRTQREEILKQWMELIEKYKELL